MAGGEAFVDSSAAVAKLNADALSNASSVLQSGQLFRYGENNSDGQFVAKLEAEFAKYHGTRFAVGVNSGGSAMYVCIARLA